MYCNQSQVQNDAYRKERIIEHMPLVKYCVGRMHVTNGLLLNYEDMIGYGTVGLIQAVDRFDDSRGAKFSSYALTRIKGAVLDAMRAIDPVGRTTREAGRRIAEESSSLALELGRNPTAREVQVASKLTGHRYWEARAATEMRKVSIDTPTEGGMRLSDLIGDGAQGPSAGMETQELRAALLAAVQSLPERNQRVIALYFGRGLTLKGVAGVMNISESRVLQLLRRTYTQLRADRALRGNRAP